MMEEIRAMDRQRVIDGFKLQLGLSEQEWTVVKPRIEAVYNLVHPQPYGGPGADAKRTEVDQRSRELRELIESKEADADKIKARLTALRAAREKADRELAKARQNLRQIMNLRQEAVLVLNELLD
jgi:chromosome segregation ATPase